MKVRLIAVAFIGLFATTAWAQEVPAGDVSGGYSFVRDQELEENFQGWVGSAAFNLSPWLGVVGEVGGNYKTLSAFGTDVDLSVHTFAGGVRTSFRGSSSVTPFAQLLVGAARASGSVLGVSESDTEFMVQPGGGVDVWFQPTVGLRIGGDYRRILEDSGANEFRFHAGIVAAFGKR